MDKNAVIDKCLTQDQLLSYVQDQCSAADVRAIDSHLSQCELCSEALEGALMVENIPQFEAHLNQLDEKINTAFPNKITGKPLLKLKSVPQSYRFWAAAASIALLITASIVYYKQANEPLKGTIVETPSPNLPPQYQTPVVAGTPTILPNITEAQKPIDEKGSDISSNLAVVNTPKKDEKVAKNQSKLGTLGSNISDYSDAAPRGADINFDNEANAAKTPVGADKNTYAEKLRTETGREVKEPPIVVTSATTSGTTINIPSNIPNGTIATGAYTVTVTGDPQATGYSTSPNLSPVKPSENVEEAKEDGLKKEEPKSEVVVSAPSSPQPIIPPANYEQVLQPNNKTPQNIDVTANYPGAAAQNSLPQTPNNEALKDVQVAGKRNETPTKYQSADTGISNYQLGMTHYNKENYPKAIAEFNRVLAKQATGTVYENTLWYLANSYLKWGKKTEAKRLFQRIVAEKTVFLQQAIVVLREWKD